MRIKSEGQRRGEGEGKEMSREKGEGARKEGEERDVKERVVHERKRRRGLGRVG